jgi:hypothetical protein
MVKGLTRRVIVIKSPDDKLFDEAIFIVRESALDGGVTGEDILEEARATADEYVRRHLSRRRLPKISAPVAAGAGAAATGLAWLVARLVFRV